MAFYLCISGKLKVTVRHISCIIVSLDYEPYDNDWNFYELQKYIGDSTANRQIYSLLGSGIYRVSSYHILNILFPHGNNEYKNYIPHRNGLSYRFQMYLLLYHSAYNPLIFRIQGKVHSCSEYVWFVRIFHKFFSWTIGRSNNAMSFSVPEAAWMPSSRSFVFMGWIGFIDDL